MLKAIVASTRIKRRARVRRVQFFCRLKQEMRPYGWICFRGSTNATAGATNATAGGSTTPVAAAATVGSGNACTSSMAAVTDGMAGAGATVSSSSVIGVLRMNPLAAISGSEIAEIPKSLARVAGAVKPELHVAVARKAAIHSFMLLRLFQCVVL